MPTPFATVQELEDAWRPLSDAEQTPAATRLAQASRIIRHRFSTIDDRITAGDLDPDLVADVAISMVIRYLRNPDGDRQVSFEDYSTTKDSAAASGDLCLTDEELDTLSPPRTAGRAFSIDTSPPASCRPVYRWA